jgi:hypothetical protein
MSKVDEPDSRETRLAAKLRENLRRRKEQAREAVREAGAGEHSSQSGSE